jgi:hypothetical protein
MGASCFTRRVCTTPVPKGFKLPHDQQKYDRSQEPQSWLSDYLQGVQILGGTKETAMQSLQLHLTGAARSWLSKLEKETIGSWEYLTKQFTSNFRSTYKRPTSIEEVKACVQQRDETLRVGMATGLLPTGECHLIPSPFYNRGDFFPIPIPIEFGAGIGFPIMKLNSNDLLIFL